LRSGGSALLAEAIKTQAPYLPCFAASDLVFSAEECRRVLAIGQARPARMATLIVLAMHLHNWHAFKI